MITACFLIAGVQCAYFAGLLIQFLRAPESLDAAAATGVSVIVCAHDEEQNLRELVPLLLEQDHAEFEVIIVQDRCNDGTIDYLRECAHADPRLRTVQVRAVPDNMNGKKFGLTLGIRAARHEWILLTDADCRPASPSWISTMSQRFASEAKIVLGYSGYRRKPGVLNAFIRFETLLTAIQYLGFARMGMPYMGVGRNLAYRKSLFLESKGFNDHLKVNGGDDDLFVNQHASQHNIRLAIGRSALVWSEPKETVREFFWQKVRHLAAGRRYRTSGKALVGVFMVSWLLLWLFAVPAAAMMPLNYLYAMAGAIVLRWVLLAVLFGAASRQLGDSFEWWKTPYLEFIYAFYYLVAGAVALVSKKVRWKI